VNGSIRNDAELESIFHELRKDKPVVVYTSTGLKASVVWFALVKMGYQARLFALSEWAEEHQSLVKPSQ
jgi:thiosulfate/3-mercaptopyruvate sulfurtransferase